MSDSKKLPSSVGEKTYVFFCYLFILILCLSILYPFIYMVSASLSSSTAVMKNDVVFLPVGFTTNAYKVVAGYNGIWVAYANTIFYTVVGTLVNLALTILAAYPLSKKRWGARKIFSFMLVFTMWFGGGQIPFYLTIKNLGLLNTRLAILIYGAISTYYVIIFRTHFESLPDSLEESARIEGANDFTILWKIMIPLSKPIMAAVGLYYAIGRWNSYFWEMMILSDENKLPVQVILQRIVINSQLSEDVASALTAGEQSFPMTIKFAAIVITALPIICIYPFLQKFFVSGALVGSVKE